MGNYVREYVKDMDSFLKEDHSIEVVNEKISEHLLKISFFQHERLIHLIVTVLFAIMDIVTLVVSFIVCNFACVSLLILFTALLVPYIFHYYFLENSVQKMYRQYDALKVLCTNNDKNIE